MILYSLPISNYCGKVLHALVSRIWNARSTPSREVTDPKSTKNGLPSGTIPALDHDGVILSESEVINEYLNEVFPDPTSFLGLRNRGQRSACFAGCMTLSSNRLCGPCSRR